MTDIELYVSDLEQHEGLTTWPYLDSRQVDGKPDPRVTFGIGEMVPNLAAFVAVGWEFNDRPATVGRVREAWDALWTEGQTIPARPAQWYRHKTSLALPEAVCRQRCAARVFAMLAEVMPERLPLSGRRVVVDLMWNCGADRFARRWPLLWSALEDGDYVTASIECQVANPDGSEGRRARNEWRRDMMLSCDPDREVVTSTSRPPGMERTCAIAQTERR